MRVGDISAEERRVRCERRRAARAGAAAAYSIRLMGSLAGSLLIILAAVHIPVLDPQHLVSWQVVSSSERLPVEFLEAPAQPRAAGSEVPITAFGIQETIAPADDDAGEDEAPIQAEKSFRQPPTARMSVRVLEFADVMPQIQGGLNSYYLNIEYPPEAQARGIEGRLVLSFVVETDGQLSEVQIISSLHPLCDSAAVRALREVRFVPGMQNGVATRVRMRLPVRFELLNQGNFSARPHETSDLRRPSRAERPRRRRPLREDVVSG